MKTRTKAEEIILLKTWANGIFLYLFITFEKNQQMYCKSCGSQIDIDSKFCSFCGTKQSEAYKPTNDINETNKSTNALQSQEQDNNINQNSKIIIKFSNDLFKKPSEFGLNKESTYVGVNDLGTYLYFQNNEYFEIETKLPQYELLLILVTQPNSISLFFYHLTNERLFKIIDVEKNKVKSFNLTKNQNFDAINYKKSSGISATGVGTVLGTRVLPIIGTAIGASIGFGISKLKEKIKEEKIKSGSYGRIQKLGGIFQLVLNLDDKEVFLSIACEEKYVGEFEKYLITNLQEKNEIAEKDESIEVENQLIPTEKPAENQLEGLSKDEENIQKEEFKETTTPKKSYSSEDRYLVILAIGFIIISGIFGIIANSINNNSIQATSQDSTRVDSSKLYTDTSINSSNSSSNLDTNRQKTYEETKTISKTQEISNDEHIEKNSSRKKSRKEKEENNITNFHVLTDFSKSTVYNYNSNKTIIPKFKNESNLQIDIQNNGKGKLVLKYGEVIMTFSVTSVSKCVLDNNTYTLLFKMKAIPDGLQFLSTLYVIKLNENYYSYEHFDIENLKFGDGESMIFSN